MAADGETRGALDGGAAGPAARSKAFRRGPWLASGIILLAATIYFAVGREPHENAEGQLLPTARLTADAAYYYHYLPSLLLDGDLDFTNQYRAYPNYYHLARTPIGRAGNVFGVGPAVFTAPFFLLGHGLARITASRPDGYGPWEVILSLWVSVLASVLAIHLAGRLIRRRLAGQLAWLLGPLIAAIGGPVLYYAVRQPGYAHPLATLFVCWLVERWDAGREGPQPRRRRDWLVLGALLGAATLVRPQLITWGLLFVPAALEDLARQREAGASLRCAASRVLVDGVIAGAAVVICLLPQFLVWKLLYGAFFVIPQGHGFMRWDSPAWLEVLFSSRNGLFPWAPVYALALAGLLALSRRLPVLVTTLMAAFAVQVVINGAVWDWWAGGAFGARRFDSCFVIFALGAGQVVAAVESRLRALPRTRRQVVASLLSGLLAAAMVVSSLAALGLAARRSGPTVPIQGGRPASETWRSVPVVGRLTGLLTDAITWPVRETWALGHELPARDFDRVVGVNLLGETFPGLNSHAPATTDHLDLAHPGRCVMDGLARTADGARMIGGKARIVFALNRRGAATIRLHARSPGTSPALVTLAWAGQGASQTLAGGASGTISITAPKPARGTNELAIEAPPGTVFDALNIEAGAASPGGS
jgi:hypothetical protein